MNDRAEEAVLIVVRNGKDNKGYPLEQKEEHPVYAKKLSATRTEFYDAYRAGLKATAVFEIRQEDWVPEATRILYDGVEYNIIRGYEKGKSKIQLTCS